MKKRFNLGLFPRRQGGNHKIANVTVNLGSTKGRGSSTRMFNYCNQHSRNPQGCINQFINIQTTSIPTPPPLIEFVYSFNYLGSNLATDIANNIPIISGNGLSYTYTYTNNSNLITVSVDFTFTDIGSNDGLYFYTYYNFYNTLTQNLKILQFGGIPLSRNNNQFREIYNLQVSAIDAPTILSNTSMEFAFYQCANLYGNFNNWNTINVTNMSHMFQGAINFNENIGNWNTINVTNMSYMFYLARYFNQNIGNWNTSNVLDMNHMFYTAINFDQNIGNWDTINVKYTYDMFNRASNFNQDISYKSDSGAWNTINVIDMSTMFKETNKFNKNIGNWNTSAVTGMTSVFRDAIAFNNGQVAGDYTSPMNWQVSQFSGVTPSNFSVGSSLTLKKTNPSDPLYPGNSPFTTTG